MRYNFSEEKIKQMYEEYCNGSSSVKLSEKYGPNPSSIISLFKRRGYSTKSCSESNQKYKINETYFDSIDNEHKAYWLGFIYADGFISTVNKRNSFGISLSIKDIDHLYKLKKDINSNHPIKKYIQSSGYIEGQEYCKFIVNNKYLVSSLIKQGVVENKTNILNAPNIPESLIKHFIRGYMDGDGCISYSVNRDEYSIKILGTENILDYIKNYIEKNNIAKINKYHKRKKEHVVSSLELGGNLQVLHFLNIIYDNATIALERKYQRYINLCNKFFVEPNGNIRC